MILILWNIEKPNHYGMFLSTSSNAKLIHLSIDKKIIKLIKPVFDEKDMFHWNTYLAEKVDY